MKRLPVILLAGLALTAAAGDLTLSIDTKGTARNAFPHGVPCVGYATDPRIGGEEAALACRRAGAWLFRTARCDDETLAFCARYGLRLFVVLDGDQAAVAATLDRLAKSPHREAIAAVQLGSDPSGGANPAMWRRIAPLAARQLPKASIALPVTGPDSPFVAAMDRSISSVTHLVVDLRDAPAPYEGLEAVAEKIRRSPDKSVAKLRLWAVGPGRADGIDNANTALAWQMHWIMSALAVDRTDGVLVERPCRADDFGLAMRHLWVATAGNRSLVGHGEGATSAVAPRKRERARTVDDLSLDDLGELSLDLGKAETGGPAPLACANVAAGRPGDVEFLVLLAPVQDDGQRVCLVLVNTTGERVRLSVDVNGNGGDVSSGWRRRLVPDKEGGGMRSSTRERAGKPLSETIEPGEVTFLDFRI